MDFKILSRETFGPEARFILNSCTDRFGEPVFIIEDREDREEKTDLPKILRIAKTRGEALGEMMWRTEDTCVTCGHDGMMMTADDSQDEKGWVRGTMACPECGAFDETAMAETEELR